MTGPAATMLVIGVIGVAYGIIGLYFCYSDWKYERDRDAAIRRVLEDL